MVRSGPPATAVTAPLVQQLKADNRCQDAALPAARAAITLDLAGMAMVVPSLRNSLLIIYNAKSIISLYLDLRATGYNE